MNSAPAGLILAQMAPDMFQQLAPLVMILAVFYFLLIRPQQKQARQHEDFVKSLKKGDAVITSGGLFGRVLEVREHDVTLEIAPNVKVRYERQKIAASAKAGGAASKAD